MEKQKDIKRLKKLRYKYRLVLMNEDDFEQKFTFRLSRLNVIGVVSVLSLFWIFVMVWVLAYTPMREYIPGYTDPSLAGTVYNLELTVDSLEQRHSMQSRYMQNIQRILRGEDLVEEDSIGQAKVYDYSGIENNISSEDSVLRAEMENQAAFNLYLFDAQASDYDKEIVAKGPVVFFKPIDGIITNQFNRSLKHYALDIVSNRNDAVKSVYDGIVVLSDWTVNTGYVIVIQHPNNFISVYKHNSALLKHEGDNVKAGDPIAIIGNSGEQSTGPHLHFELWANGSPVDPLNYINF